MNKMKLVLFDLGKVLINNDVDQFYRPISDDTGIDTDRIKKEYESDILISLETGEISFEDYVAYYQKRWNLKWDCEKWIESYQAIFSLNKIGNEIRMHLKNSGFPTAILSNLAEYHKIAIDRSFPEILDGHIATFYSYEIGLHKPNPKIYQNVCEVLSVEPQDIFFLDDKLENVKSANSFGLNGVLFSEENLENILEIISSISNKRIHIDLGTLGG